MYSGMLTSTMDSHLPWVSCGPDDCVCISGGRTKTSALLLGAHLSLLCHFLKTSEFLSYAYMYIPECICV